MPTAASPSDGRVRPVGLFATPLTLGELGVTREPIRDESGRAGLPSRIGASLAADVVVGGWRQLHNWNTPNAPDRFNSTELFFGGELG